MGILRTLYYYDFRTPGHRVDAFVRATIMAPHVAALHPAQDQEAVPSESKLSIFGLGQYDSEPTSYSLRPNCQSFDYAPYNDYNDIQIRSRRHRSASRP